MRILHIFSDCWTIWNVINQWQYRSWKSENESHWVVSDSFWPHWLCSPSQILARSFPGDLPNPGIKPRSPALQTGILPAELPGKPIMEALQVDSLPAEPPEKPNIEVINSKSECSILYNYYLFLFWKCSDYFNYYYWNNTIKLIF